MSKIQSAKNTAIAKSQTKQKTLANFFNMV
jgi:hypothetical protein